MTDGWAYIAAWHAVAGLATAAAYAVDKARARRGGRRLRESTLHALEAAGGWLGGAAARPLLRHKTRDVRFLVISWVIVALHALAWAAWWWWRQP